MLNSDEIKRIIVKSLKNLAKPIIVVILIAVIIVSLFWAVVDGILKAAHEIFDDVSDHIEINGNNIEIEQDYLEEAKKKLEQLGVNPNSLGFGEEAEYLERFLEAEVVTSYPYLGGDGLQGAVYFERAKIDGTTTQLKYIEYNEFYNKVNNGDGDINDYFTVDTNDWTVHVMKNDGNIEKINYKNMVEKFAMPFEFPISLALISQNPQFALAVVKLVKDSRIVITIAESKTTTTTTNTETYTETINVSKDGQVTNILDQSGVQGSSTTSTEETYSTEIFLSRAQTWILNEVTELKYDDSTESDDPVVTDLPSEVTEEDNSDGSHTTRFKTERKNTKEVTRHYQRWVRGTTKVIDKSSNFTNLILRDSSLINGQGLVEIAKTLHDYLAENQYWYPSSANLAAGGYVQDGDPITHKFPVMGEESSQRYVDCSAYVSWILKEAGYDIPCYTVSGLDEYGKNMGWDIIDNINDVQAGDLCIWSGGNHINICVGKNDAGELIYYDCGNTKKIREIDPVTYNANLFDHALRPNDEIAQALNPKTKEDLKQQIQEYIDRITEGTYSVKVVNLNKTSDSITINNERVESNGFIKIFVMATAYNEIKSGKINEEEVFADLERMITADDNSATNAVLKVLGNGDIQKGVDVVNQYLRANGYNATKLEGELDQNSYVGNEQTYTTINNVSTILEKIFKGTCVNKEYSEKMMTLLKQQIITDMIPSTIIVGEGETANKTGEQTGILQDAAIISTENANYLIVISAKDVESTDMAKNNIIEIAKIVNTYFAQTGNLNDNTDNFEDDDELDIIMVGRKVCYKLPNQAYQCPLNNLVEGREMLFKLLREFEETQKHERLMRYLLYLLTGNDYGVTEFDFNEFLNGSFSDVGSFVGNSIQERVWWALRDAGYSAEATAGVMGNIEAESGFNPEIIEGGSGIGFGLCQWSYGRRTQLEAYAASKGVEPSDVDTQIEFLLGEITPGGGANGYASYNLMSNHGYTANDWKNASTPEEAAEIFCWIFERPGIPRMDVRKEAARRYYEQFKDAERPATGTDGPATEMQQRIVEIASSKDTLGTVGGQCQAWVSRVYLRAGQSPQQTKPCASEAANAWVVSKDKNNIPLGACVYGHAWIYSDGSQAHCGGHEAGHVGIYIGNGQVASNVGGIRIDTLDKWISYYGWKGWGWNGGTDYSK